ncbi:MAG: hypothetical protein JWO46_907 [Nocardioidaceae bacterium]|nr:hypothetical protein [Nocardioidaceae bacterium]
MPEPPPPSFAVPGVVPPRTSQQAIWALVLGILGVTCCTAIAGIPAIVLGVRASRAIKASDGQLTGSGLATAGWVLGIVSVVFLLGYVALWLTGAISLEGRFDFS